MNYKQVFIDALGYELAPVVITSEELEERLAPLYQSKRMSVGQLEVLTGIRERRWWDEGYTLTQGATCAARRARVSGRILLQNRSHPRHVCPDATRSVQSLDSWWRSD